MNYNKTPEALVEKWKAETEEILAKAAELIATADKLNAEATYGLASIEIANQKQADAHDWEVVCQIWASICIAILLIGFVYLSLFTVKSAKEWFKPVQDKFIFDSRTGQVCDLKEDGRIICR